MKRVHYMPLGLSEMVLRMVQSMAIRKTMGEMIHPWHMSDFTGNLSEFAVNNDNAFIFMIEQLNIYVRTI